MISVPYRTSSGNSWIPIESHLLPEGKIFIKDEITSESACEFVQQVMYLRKDAPEKRIKIYVNSPGGEVNGGLVIYDTLKSLDVDFDIYCIGMAASMAAIILAAGKKGRRYILPHSKIMIHEPLISGGVGGSATSIQRTAESILETKRISVELLAADTGKSIEEVEKAISFDNYMNSKEAIEFGICDEIKTGIF